MRAEQNKIAIRRLIDEVWNQRAFEELDKLFATDAVISESGVPFPSRGPTYAKEGIGTICAAFPDIRTSVDDIFAEGDSVVVRWSSLDTR